MRFEAVGIFREPNGADGVLSDWTAELSGAEVLISVGASGGIVETVTVSSEVSVLGVLDASLFVQLAASAALWVASEQLTPPVVEWEPVPVEWGVDMSLARQESEELLDWEVQREPTRELAVEHGENAGRPVVCRRGPSPWRAVS